MRQLGIIGTGLIGASIGLAARGRGWRVLGYDVDSHATSQAQLVGALDRIAERDEIYETCALVGIATHIKGTLDEIEALRKRPARDDLLVIDIASVKEPIARAAGGIASFVPTHPMAGSERSGPEAARADRFEGRTWCYVPTADAQRTTRARAFVASLGAMPVAVDAKKHDRTVALTSHLPQLVAYVLSERINERAREDAELVAALCGPAARELLRLGRSSRAMWDEIFEINGADVETELTKLREALDDRRLSR
jgi:prephenate dehydrogenase